MKPHKTTRLFKAYIMHMQKSGTPVTVTPEMLQDHKEYEERCGETEIAMVLDDRNMKLAIAESWPGESRIDVIGQNGGLE